MKLVLATRNSGKIRELAEILAARGDVEILSLADFPNAPEVIEDGDTYEANAIKKATQIAEHTGQLTLADDSGLEVDALNGAPGVYSARYAGADASDAQRIEKLLGAINAIPDNQRTARFRCVAAIVAPGRSAEVVVGVCEGRIIHVPRGDQGFGYDPIFVPTGYNQTFAELGEAVKNRMSHRWQALKKASELLF